MPFWILAVIIGVAIILGIDFLIVMGKNPKHWKGGEKDGR